MLLYRALANSTTWPPRAWGWTWAWVKSPTCCSALNRGDVPQVPALTLGAGEYSPWIWPPCTGTIAAGGFACPAQHPRVVDAQGEPLRRYPWSTNARSVCRPPTCSPTPLRAVVREGTGKGVYRYLSDGFDVAGKTGTPMMAATPGSPGLPGTCWR